MTVSKSPVVLASALLAVVVAVPARADIDGKEFYMLRCATCHGVDGQGSRHLIPPLAPALKGNPFITEGSAAAIRNVIRKGRAGKKRLYDDAYPNMPSFGTEVVPDVDAVVTYLKGNMQK
jgi:mono/diheme cytochrome c family protein